MNTQTNGQPFKLRPGPHKEKKIPKDNLEYAFDQFDEGEDINVIANMIGLSPARFLELHTAYKEKLEEKRQAYEAKTIGFKGFPTLAEKLKEALVPKKEEESKEEEMPKEKVKPKAKRVTKKKKVKTKGKGRGSPVSSDIRKKIIRDIKNGDKNVDIAQRYGVPDATVSNIKYRLRLDGGLPPAGEPIEPPKRKAPKEEPREPKESLDAKIQLYFEGEYLVVKIPKRDVTRTILKDFL